MLNRPSFLDQSRREVLEEKAELIEGIYKQLTTKEITIEFIEEPKFYKWSK